MNIIRAFVLPLCLAAASAGAQEPVLPVYGPGGPAPAMKEAAAAFGAKQGLRVEVTAGPTPEWADRAKQDADVIFSGAENMMSGFATALPGVFDLREAEPLYLRPAAILVRPGNPKRIYRDAGIVLTRRGKEDAAAKSFVEFVKSSEGQRIFAKWGWITAKR